jgi:BA14K-like protein
MTRTLAAGSAAAIAILMSIAPAAAQEEAQDRCKEVVPRDAFRNPEVKQDTFYWLARYSAEVAQQSDGISDPPIAFVGITAALSPADIEHLLRPLLLPADWQTIYQNRAAVLLASGQAPILKAWQQCMADQGGGLTAYFQTTAVQSPTVELHIDYRRPESGPELPALKIARNLPIDPRLGKITEGSECLVRNYTLTPGKECVVKIETASLWITGTIAIPVTDGKTAKDYSAYLGPRATLRGEQKTWPTEKMTSDWAKAHPGDNPINVLSRYADERTGPKTWDISAQREAEEGWFFVEGARTMSADNAYALQSDDVHVVAKTGGAASAQDCVGGYRIDPGGKILLMGIGLGASGSGPSWCYVTVTATMARLVWEPPMAGTAAAAAPAAAPRRASAPPAGDERAAACQQKFRSYDPQTGTYLGTDGNRHPCP